MRQQVFNQKQISHMTKFRMFLADVNGTWQLQVLQIFFIHSPWHFYYVYIYAWNFETRPWFSTGSVHLGPVEGDYLIFTLRGLPKFPTFSAVPVEVKIKWMPRQPYRNWIPIEHGNVEEKMVTIPKWVIFQLGALLWFSPVGFVCFIVFF